MTRKTTTFQRSNNGLDWHADAEGETATALNLLFVGATIANFEYWSEFVLRIQREDSHRTDAIRKVWGDVRVPPLFCLRLRNAWWVGDQLQWEETVEQFPIKPPVGMPKDTTLQSSVAVQMLGATILDLKVTESGHLDIAISNGTKLHIEGRGGEWEESWILELLADDPDRDSWSVVCDSDGIVYAKWPGAPGSRPGFGS